MTKVFILPGLSSPNCERYRPVYDPLVEESAHRLPGSRPEVILLPGQVDSAGERVGEFLVPEASARVRAHLEPHASEGVLIIARSSGCNVAAHLLANWKASPVRKAVFWGPPPFWLYHHMFVRNRDANYAQAEATGVRISQAIAATATPFESLLQETDCRVLICAGSQDDLCTPAYVAYLRTLFANKPSVQFAEIEGCGHTVTKASELWDQYVDTVFGWLCR